MSKTATPTYNQAIKNLHYIRKQMVDRPEVDRFDLYMREMHEDDVIQMAADYNAFHDYTKDQNRVWCKVEVRIGERTSYLFLVSRKMKIKNEKMNFSSN